MSLTFGEVLNSLNPVEKTIMVVECIVERSASTLTNCRLALVPDTGFTFTFEYGAGYTTPVAGDQTGFEVAGSNNTITFATYDTLKKVVDALNGTNMLRAWLVNIDGSVPVISGAGNTFKAVAAADGNCEVAGGLALLQDADGAVQRPAYREAWGVDANYITWDVQVPHLYDVHETSGRVDLTARLTAEDIRATDWVIG